MLDKLGYWLLQNPLNAAVVAFSAGFALFLGPIAIFVLGWISLFIVAFVALCTPFRFALIVLVAALIPDLLWALFGHSSTLLYRSLAGSVFLFIMARVLRYSISWRRVLELTSLLALASVLVVHAYQPNINQWWYQHYRKDLTQVKKEVTQLTEQADLNKQQAQQARENLQQSAQLIQDSKLLQLAAKVSTGTVVITSLIGSLFLLIIARAWQALLFNPGGLSKELRNIRLGYVIGVLTIIAGLAGILGSNLAFDIIAVLLISYLCSGLSLVHGLLTGMNRAWLGLVTFYLVLILFAPYSLLLLVLFAFADTWLDFRQRLKAPGN